MLNSGLGQRQKKQLGSWRGKPSASPSTTTFAILKCLRSSPLFLFSPWNASHGPLDKESSLYDSSVVTLFPPTLAWSFGWAHLSRVLISKPQVWHLTPQFKFWSSSLVCVTWSSFSVPEFPRARMEWQSSCGIVTRMPSNCESSA